MKPEEAKEKWCPFCFGAMGRSNMMKQEWFMCIAGECMAWDHKKGYCKLIEK